jgi:type I restriction enzyme R subunit
VLDEVAKQMAELLKEVNKEKKSFKDLGITYEEKAFYDILKEIANKFGFEYPEDKLLKLAAAVKKMIDDKSKYTDWANRTDIKAELQMDLILILADHDYPPVPQDDVFKEIFEQAENFKKYEKADNGESDVVDTQTTIPFDLINALTTDLENKGYQGQSNNITIDNHFHKTVRKVINKEAKLVPPGSVLNDVEDDQRVRALVHNMIELYEGTTILKIVAECQKEFGEKYVSMSRKEWHHLIGDYVRSVTERPELQDDEEFRYSLAG